MSGQPPRIFDRHALMRARLRAKRIDGDVFLAREAGEGLRERLNAVNRRFSCAADIDSLQQSRALLRSAAETWTDVDLGVDETIALELQSYDLVTSVLALHSVNDLPGALIQIRRALKPDGLFMAALFGGMTLTELRASLVAAELDRRGGVSPRVFPFADVRDLGGLLQRAGFALPVADSERTTVCYRDFSTLIRDLRSLGETNVLATRSRRPISRAMLGRTIENYRGQYAEADGRLRATFDIVYLTAWAPDESQQKPLRPGSAKSRLADALGTDEQSAGETAPKAQKS